MVAAKKRNIEFNVTKEYCWGIFEKQQYKCAITGLDLCMCYQFSSKNQTASLDRIDNSKGYIEGNLQWVHKDINRMKWCHSEEYFKKMCRLVVEFEEKGKNDQFFPFPLDKIENIMYDIKGKSVSQDHHN